MAADRLALAHAIEDAGIARDKAERVASAIFDAINDNVATKADVAGVRSDLATIRSELKAEVAQVASKLELVEHRMLTRLGGLSVVLFGLLVAAMHYWPPR
jgi:hypothetical protein